MNRSEHLLTVLSEECSEVSKEICKGLRFGLDDQLTLDPHGPRGTEGPTNREKIADEMVDLLATYNKCVEEGILPDLGICSVVTDVLLKAKRKSDRIDSYMQYAQSVGALNQ